MNWQREVGIIPTELTEQSRRMEMLLLLGSMIASTSRTGLGPELFHNTGIVGFPSRRRDGSNSESRAISSFGKWTTRRSLRGRGFK